MSEYPAVITLCHQARQAAAILAHIPTAEKNRALHAMAGITESTVS